MVITWGYLMICRSEYADTSMNSSIEGENSSAHDESLNSSVDSTTEAGKKREPLKPKNRFILIHGYLKQAFFHWFSYFASKWISPILEFRGKILEFRVKILSLERKECEKYSFFYLFFLPKLKIFSLNSRNFPLNSRIFFLNSRIGEIHLLAK